MLPAALGNNMPQLAIRACLLIDFVSCQLFPDNFPSGTVELVSLNAVVIFGILFPVAFLRKF